MNEKLPNSRPSFPLSTWLQLGAGLAFVGLIYYIGVSSTSYLSEWEEKNSNFYEASMEALGMFGVHPTAPTAVIFWEVDNEDSKKNIQAFSQSPSNLRIYGIHLSIEGSEIEIRKDWLKNAPHSSQLIIDHEDLLKTSFKVIAVPMVFIILPKQKKIFSYWADIKLGRKRMLEIIMSESTQL